MNGSNIVKVENLKKSYEMGRTSVEVLKGIDFSLSLGEFVMVVGPSGSGKSTLLHLVAGLDRPTEGKISVLGKSLGEMPDRQISFLRNQKIGFIFQFYHLLPELTAYENVALPLLVYSSEKRVKGHRKIEDMFDMIGLNNRSMHRPQELSGGEQQRLAIARALVHDPEILLADEPTGNLDTANGNAILDLLDQIRKKNHLSILMVTHNPDFLKRADRVLYLKDGKIQA
ncbi:MAG: ABC transporter ATP-binding protein [Chlamydiae bacterium]|nr:ABC transporter ATP-binding protein [Chlamydiota bacterium]MBI3265890.1 ABC transporter ATP-binding protein [Chlamydiota bacterium]